MSNADVQKIRSRIWRRIVVKTALLAVWTAGLLYVALRGGQELAQGAYWYMLLFVVAVWAVSTVRDVRRLRDDEALRKAAIEESDERNVLLSYKAMRLSVTITACLLAVAVLVLALYDMQDAINVIAYVICAFLVMYVASWFYVSRKY